MKIMTRLTKQALENLKKQFEKIHGRRPKDNEIAYYPPYSEIYVCKPVDRK